MKQSLYLLDRQLLLERPLVTGPLFVEWCNRTFASLSPFCYQFLNCLLLVLTFSNYCLTVQDHILSVVCCKHRVATAAFWRTFHHEGKSSPGW
jgi:hypothetical protein